MVFVLQVLLRGRVSSDTQNPAEVMEDSDTRVLCPLGETGMERDVEGWEGAQSPTDRQNKRRIKNRQQIESGYLSS